MNACFRALDQTKLNFSQVEGKRGGGQVALGKKTLKENPEGKRLSWSSQIKPNQFLSSIRKDLLERQRRFPLLKREEN